MTGEKLIETISQKKIEPEKIANQVIKNPELLSTVLEGVHAKKANIKYGCEKVLRKISEKDPDLLYPH